MAGEAKIGEGLNLLVNIYTSEEEIKADLKDAAAKFQEEFVPKTKKSKLVIRPILLSTDLEGGTKPANDTPVVDLSTLAGGTPTANDWNNWIDSKVKSSRAIVITGINVQQGGDIIGVKFRHKEKELKAVFFFPWIKSLTSTYYKGIKFPFRIFYDEDSDFTIDLYITATSGTQYCELIGVTLDYSGDVMRP